MDNNSKSLELHFKFAVNIFTIRLYNNEGLNNLTAEAHMVYFFHIFMARMCKALKV